MDTLLKADIFFFITTIVTFLLAVLIAAILIYVLRIALDVKHISGRVREETDSIAYDVKQFRTRIKDEGITMRNILEFLGILEPPKKKSRKQT